MSDDVAIHVKGLGKKYAIGGPQEKYLTLREALANSVKKPFRMMKRQGASQSTNEFWALKDVSFDVHEGEVVGIIGRNGAGKSTLLKILSQITTPTEGIVDIYGRVGSLLEVGTGFHPELTGRENIFLSGSILGMRKREIEEKFDEIVKFAEIEKFLDTPVKRYSSGMYVRLAFAVAAHMDTEILLVDEVLAVGDAAFQKKCIGKMGDVAKGGRTVLFVSHNMGVISSLCSRTILLSNGIKIGDGDSDDVIEKYIFSSSENLNSRLILDPHQNRSLKYEKILKEVEIFSDGILSSTLKMGGNLKIITKFSRNIPIDNMRFGISIENIHGQRIVNFSPSHQIPDLFNNSLNEGKIVCDIPNLPLIEGAYHITLIIGSGADDLDRIDQAIQFNVESADVFNTGQIPQKSHGIFYLKSNWEISKT
jgi:lipopolysaccharide transport system ATP-binding protein